MGVTPNNTGWLNWARRTTRAELELDVSCPSLLRNAS
jgi:hypothetical protein